LAGILSLIKYDFDACMWRWVHRLPP
jgi:hypothetical protein